MELPIGCVRVIYRIIVLVVILIMAYMLQPTLDDTQCTCAFVGLKKGVQRTFKTISEVIQKLKDAVQLNFGNYAVPQSCLVSSAVK